MAAKTRVLFLIPSLVAHGAERQLCELVRHMDRRRHEVHVVVFYDPGCYIGGELGPEIASLPGVTLHSLHKRRGTLGNLLMLPRLFSLALEIDPHVLHGYLDGNLPALLAGLVLRRPVAWGIRQSRSDSPSAARRVVRMGDLLARCSPLADLVIFNSEKGRASYAEAGLIGRRTRVIPNGFDVQRFSPDPAAGAAQRRTWGIPEGGPLVGIVGRLAPVKDHGTFLRAASRVLASCPEARFVCIGSDPEGQLPALQALAGTLGLKDRVCWAGACTDMRSAYAALTVLALTSRDEGFPNAIGEAMACGVPCVSTRAGDAARLVAETGRIVEPGDHEGIAAGLLELLQEPPEAKAARRQAVRERICGTFSVQALARNTEAALAELRWPG